LDFGGLSNGELNVHRINVETLHATSLM